MTFSIRDDLEFILKFFLWLIAFGNFVWTFLDNRIKRSIVFVEFKFEKHMFTIFVTKTLCILSVKAVQCNQKPFSNHFYRLQSIMFSFKNDSINLALTLNSFWFKFYIYFFQTTLSTLRWRWTWWRLRKTTTKFRALTLRTAADRPPCMRSRSNNQKIWQRSRKKVSQSKMSSSDVQPWIR